MAIRYVAAPMMGPSAREERMREERQKNVVKSVQSLSSGYLRQSAIDTALEQQRGEAAAAEAQKKQASDFDQSQQRSIEAQQQQFSDSLRRASDERAVNADPMIAAANAMLASANGSDPQAQYSGQLALPPTGGTPGSLVGPSAPWGGPSVDTAWRDTREDEPSQLVDRAKERMFSQRVAHEMQIAKDVEGRLAAEAPGRRSLDAQFPESFAGAGRGSRPDLFRDDRREDQSGGQDRMMAIQEAIARAGASGGGYGIASPEAGDREGGLPGRYRPAIDFAGEFDDSARIERIGEPLLATSEQSPGQDAGITRSDELDAEWRASNDAGGRGTLQEGLIAYQMAEEGLGNQWFQHFISGDSGATEEVLDQFMAYTALTEMPSPQSGQGSTAAKRALGGGRLADNIAPGDFDAEYGMPRGDDPRRRGGS